MLISKCVSIVNFSVGIIFVVIDNLCWINLGIRLSKFLMVLLFMVNEIVIMSVSMNDKLKFVSKCMCFIFLYVFFLVYWLVFWFMIGMSKFK